MGHPVPLAAPAGGPFGARGPGQECRPDRCDSHCDGTCSTPPLSGDLVCGRPLRLKIETRAGQNRDKAATVWDLIDQPAPSPVKCCISSRPACDLAPVAGDVERGDCDGGDQQQAGQGRGRWQGQEVHHCFLVQQETAGKVRTVGQAGDHPAFVRALHGLWRRASGPGAQGRTHPHGTQDVRSVWLLVRHLSGLCPGTVRLLSGLRKRNFLPQTKSSLTGWLARVAVALCWVCKAGEVNREHDMASRHRAAHEELYSS